MASNFAKLLETIESENTALRDAHARLGKAFEKLDGRLTRMGANTRIEPYEIDKKSGVVIGYRRFEGTWNICTVIQGIAGLEAEVPVTEAPPERQALLMPHVAELLGKIAAALSENVKDAKKAVDTAEDLLAAMP